ncbi:minor extracellular serine protease Vpr [Natronobacillus azotifigens]|nr:S8 family serine peptidase [Natronobacillus azotifigens]
MKCIQLLIIILLISSSIFIAIPPSSAALQMKTIIIELDDSPEKNKQWIETYYPTLEVLEVFDTLFNGIAIKGRQSQLKRLVQQDFVKKTYPIQTYQLPAEFSTNHSELNREELNPATLPTRDDQLADYTGKGIKIGVIDTGIDYRHPDLETNFRGGYDLVDLDDDPMETQSYQGLPTIHGTHVAGIIAANGEITGIAPEAELYGYRALGPGGSGTTIQVIAALEKAVKDGMDIINMSLGNAINGPDWPTSIAVNHAVEKGVVVVIANGNAGPENWTVGSPATATKAIAVGASTSLFTLPILEDLTHNKEIPLTPAVGAKEWDLKQNYPLVYGGLGDQPITNARGKIVLFQRGEISFTDKVKQAEAAGARAVLIYNNSAEEFQAGLEEETSLPVATIAQADGTWLLEQLNRGTYWVNSEWRTMDNQIATFSSRGPVTVNWEIKPEIVAPGVDIISTVPEGYQSLQGTSMSAPYVAGALALLKEAQPTWTPEQLKGALLTQALPIENHTPIEQGMGEIRILDAIDTSFIIKNPLLSFGRIEERKVQQQVEIEFENTSEQAQHFSFSIPKQTKGIRWHLPLSFTLEPGEQTTREVALEITSDWLDEGIHQGYLELRSDQESYQLPYLFVNKTADYDKVMGFELELKSLTANMYLYNIYLPDPVDELIIDLYDPTTFAHVQTIVEREALDVGILEGEIPVEKIDPQQSYIVNITINSGDQETNYQQFLSGTP